MIQQTLNGSSLPSIPSRFLRFDEQGRLVVSRAAMYAAAVENNTLREDQTREIEEALTRVARRDLVATARLRAAGLTSPLAKGIGATTFEFDRVSPVGEATQGMSILNLGDRDLVTFARTAIPVPVTASQFRMDARHQAAGRGMGEPVDVTNVEEHTRAVAEKLDDTLTNGSAVVLGGNGLPGYTNFSSRSQHSFSDGPWTTASALSAAVTDVLAMRQALRNNGFSGPYDLHLPSNFDGVIDEDYKAESDRTLRERLQAIDGVSNIFVNPSLADSNVLLVQMTRSVVQMAVGQDITVVTWDEMGGLAGNWAILAVLTYALKAAAAREPLSGGTLPALTTAAGIAHLS
jgi:uncharacterized linocin/CFP29 family protein